ncbi:hypothetical protein A0H81_00618, partial [Grifola frondosa]
MKIASTADPIESMRAPLNCLVPHVWRFSLSVRLTLPPIIDKSGSSGAANESYACMSSVAGQLLVNMTVRIFFSLGCYTINICLR